MMCKVITSYSWKLTPSCRPVTLSLLSTEGLELIGADIGTETFSRSTVLFLPLRHDELGPSDSIFLSCVVAKRS